MPNLTPQILWIGAADPWSRWTLSGISREICLELNRRGLLYGAVAVENLTLRHMRGPAPLYDLEYKIVRKLRNWGFPAPSWNDEHDGQIGKVLRQCPPGTIVIYALVRPKIDQTLQVRRFRWMDLSLFDAVSTGTFGYAGMSEAARDVELADERRMLAACEGVVSLSTYAADSIARDIGFPRESITPIGAGSALDLTSPQPVDSGRYKSAKILFVGRDWKRKRGDLIVDALRVIQKTIPHASLTIVGPTAPPVPIVNGINFIGPLDKGKRSDLAVLHDLYLKSNVLCMASASEPWGLVYVEAAQYGLPVVALNDWALPDIVEDGITGRLVSSPRAELLADALKDILGNPRRAEEMGHAAQARVTEVLSWPAVVDRMLSRIAPSLLNGRQPIDLKRS